MPQAKQLHLIVLNWHLPVLTARLWHQATTRICADGGANRLHDQIPLLASGFPDAAAARAAFLPDIIKGDLDSVRADVRDYYTSRGVPMVDLSSDQDTTDLTKCLMFLSERITGGGGSSGGNHKGGANSSSGDVISSGGSTGSGGSITVDGEAARKMRDKHAIVVLGALGGRLDHIISHLNNLYAFPHLDITLCGDGNLVRLLPRGRCTVRPHPEMEGPTCGLVPLAAPAVCSSRGLKWDLDDTEMRFRGLISTSNILVAPEVEVTADEELIWITEFARDSRHGCSCADCSTNGCGGAKAKGSDESGHGSGGPAGGGA